MISAKLFEVRDSMTFMPMLAVQMDPARVVTEREGPGPDQYPTREQADSAEAEVFLLRRAGYGYDRSLVLFTSLRGNDACEYDPACWHTNRTRSVAHAYIAEHWDELKSGDVIDVELILGLHDTPKISERLTAKGGDL